jgi:hypothetical protein
VVAFSIEQSGCWKCFKKEIKLSLHNRTYHKLKEKWSIPLSSHPITNFRNSKKIDEKGKNFFHYDLSLRP